MTMREGSIPTTLGTVVTATGAALLAFKVAPKIASGVIGFGLAHVVLGSMDLAEHRKRKSWGW